MGGRVHVLKRRYISAFTKTDMLNNKKCWFRILSGMAA
jgi:hypothetical protein